MTFRVGHANIHSNPQGLRHLAGLGLRAFGTCETNGAEGTRLAEYAPFYGGHAGSQPGAGSSDRRAGDTCVWRHRAARYLGAAGFRAARPSAPHRVAGLTRFWSAQFFTGGEGIGPVGLWELHPHFIGAAADDPTVDRVAKVHEGMQDLATLLGAYETLGVANIVVGDFNLPERADSAGWVDPWEVLARLEFTVYGSGLDGAGASPRLRITDMSVIPADRLGSDHPGLILTVGRIVDRPRRARVASVAEIELPPRAP